MDTITTINIEPLLELIYNGLACLGFFTVVIVVVFLIYSRKNVKQFAQNSHELDLQMLLALQQKYPDVKQEFIIKPEREQNIDNNQELHQHNLRLKRLEQAMEDASLLKAIYMEGIENAN